MGLLSVFKRKTDASPPAASGNRPNNDPADEVMRARVRARQRLIGAAVLVVIGIIGFPLVFETQPRPIPVDIPIEIPRKEGAAPLAMPPARGTAPRTQTPPASSGTPATAAAPVDEVITEPRDDAAARPVAAASAANVAKPAERSPSTPAVQAAAKPPEPKPPESKPVEPKPAKPPEAKVATAAQASESARAKALLEGKDAAAAKAETGRFVVQVGAFSDVAAAREMRQKAEKLGLKTYTQVASTSAGNRIRVRIGPFASRDEADKALAKAKGAGLSAVVLTL
ncbi:MAG TPA: SPOR domain-containing protein [Burkholderiaceae bacterium]|nr:SPOR domain-containing protein [Burkholderiaceae bacterium]